MSKNAAGRAVAAVEDGDDNVNTKQGDQPAMPSTSTVSPMNALQKHLAAFRINSDKMPSTSTLAPASVLGDTLAATRSDLAGMPSKSTVSPRSAVENRVAAIRRDLARKPSSNTVSPRNAIQDRLVALRQAQGKSSPSDGKEAVRSSKPAAEPVAGPSGLKPVARLSKKPFSRVSDKGVQATVSHGQEPETSVPPPADDETSELKPRQRVPRFYREPYQPPHKRRQRDSVQNDERTGEEEQTGELESSTAFQAPMKVQKTSPTQPLKNAKRTNLQDVGVNASGPIPKPLPPAAPRATAPKIDFNALLKYGPYMRSPYQHQQPTPVPFAPPASPPVSPPPEEEPTQSQPMVTSPPPIPPLPGVHMLPSSPPPSPPSATRTAAAYAAAVPIVPQMPLPIQSASPQLPPTQPGRMYAIPMMYVGPVLWPAHQRPPLRALPREVTIEQEIRKFIKDIHSISLSDYGIPRGRGRLP